MKRAARILPALVCLIAGLTGFSARADVFLPAYLELRELGDDRYSVLWRVPTIGNSRRLAADVRFPDSGKV